MFWFWAVAIGVLAAGYMTWPVLKTGRSARNYMLALIMLVPLSALFLYQQVGTPDGIDVIGKPQPQRRQPDDHTAAGGAQLQDMVASLERRLQENPADLSGWLLLGRTYKTVQRYQEAESALLRAAQLAPNDALVLVELAEAKLYASGNPTISGEVQDMLERALLVDPDQQKALWLLGIAASQSGNDALAVELWERLAALVDPASGVSASLAEQIANARARLGEVPAAAWPGIGIEVSVEDPAFETPPGAVLFIIARNPGVPGPPLGVRRIENPGFPVRITLTDSDSMMAQAPVSGVASLQLLARLSMSGSVVAGPDDLSSPSRTVARASTESVTLNLAVP